MRQRMNTAKYLGHRKGFTLIELLIAMLVLAVGILGAAGMQITALRSLKTSGSHGMAAMLANDIADRMWVNQAQVLADAYDHTVAPSTPPDCVASVCTSAQITTYDINEWQQQITGYTTADSTYVPAMLPSAQGSVARIGATTSFLISLRWDDDRSGSTDTNCPPQSDDDLDCYTLTVTF